MNCVICEERKQNLICCKGNHSVCDECFQKWINNNLTSTLNIKCVQCDEYYTKKEILKFCPDGLVEKIFSNNIIELPETKTEKDLIDYYKNLLNETNNKYCPNCRTVFIDFEGCVKLTCNQCGIYFCGLCLDYCNSDADTTYSHINNICEFNTEKKVYYSLNEVNAIHAQLIKKRKDTILNHVKLTQNKKILVNLVETSSSFSLTKKNYNVPNDYSIIDLLLQNLNPSIDLMHSFHNGIITNKEAKDYMGNTSYHYIALSGNYQALKNAIEENSLDPFLIKNFFGITIFDYLAVSGNYQALKNAIEDFNCNNVSLWNCLARSGNYQSLMDSIIDFEYEPTQSLWNNLALSGNYNGLKHAISEFNIEPDQELWKCLAKSGNYDALKLAMKEFGCESNQELWEQLAQSGNYEALRVSINEFKYDPFLITHNGTIWHNLALSGNYKAIIKSIEDFKYNPCTLKNLTGQTIFFYLAKKDNYPVLKELIHKFNYDPKSEDNSGLYCFHYLTIINDNKAFIQSKIDFQWDRKTYVELFMEYYKKSHVESKFLLKYGSSIISAFMIVKFYDKCIGFSRKDFLLGVLVPGVVMTITGLITKLIGFGVFLNQRPQ